ncbi:MAG: hypothetical protein N838_33220 [Thiohalocapsa sp. PB-PSB1]|jgi:predicted Zn-dependent protease|nr:MAG: hypothetical protein N838_33220 [Thiohalocapsa sp. PB-PSB1]
MLSKVKRGQGEKGSEPFSKAFGNVKYLENDSMTQLLEQAFKVASGLPAFEQNALARRILAELDSERRWDAAFADSEDLLAELAAEALDDEQKGRTTPLDIDKL